MVLFVALISVEVSRICLSWISICIVECFTIRQLEKLKCLPILFSDIVSLCQTIQVVNQVHHFFILTIIVKGDYWNAIIYLECKAVDAIVDDYYVFQVPILEDSEILHIVALLCQETVLPVKAVRDILMVRIDVV